MRVNLVQRLVQRLVCGGCGKPQRAKTRSDGSQSPCYGCGPTTWLSLPTLAPQKIEADPFWDHPQPVDIFWARAYDAGYSEEG